MKKKPKTIRRLISVRSDLWEAFTDFCDTKELKYSKVISGEIYKLLKKEYNGGFKLPEIDSEVTE